MKKPDKNLQGMIAVLLQTWYISSTDCDYFTKKL